MPEAVIVDAIRTPIGRAFKGSLKDVRADDLAAIPLRALQERNPDVDFGQTQDVMMGAASWFGEQNVQRRAHGAAAGRHRPPRPGDDGQPVLRLVAADDPDGLPRDQGRRRRPVRRGRRRVGVAHRHRQRDRRRAQASEARRRRELALRRLHPDGDDRGERRGEVRRRREAQDEWAALSQQRAVAARDSGHFDAEIVPVRRRTGPRSRATTVRGPAPRSRSSPGSSRPSARTAPSRPATPARSTTAPRRCS